MVVDGMVCITVFVSFYVVGCVDSMCLELGAHLRLTQVDLELR